MIPPRVRSEYGSRLKYVLLLPAVVWVVAFTFLPVVSVIRYSFAGAHEPFLSFSIFSSSSRNARCRYSV